MHKYGVYLVFYHSWHFHARIIIELSCCISVPLWPHATGGGIKSWMVKCSLFVTKQWITCLELNSCPLHHMLQIILHITCCCLYMSYRLRNQCLYTGLEILYVEAKLILYVYLLCILNQICEILCIFRKLRISRHKI